MSDADILKLALKVFHQDNKKSFTTWRKVSHIGKWAVDIQLSSKCMKHRAEGDYLTSGEAQSEPATSERVSVSDWDKDDKG